MFVKTSCEEAGISAKKVLDFLKYLEKRGICAHSVLMARGNKLFLECNYAPIDRNFYHRMYSISKSFVSIAVGLAATEGLLSLDDRIIDYFPEYRNQKTDELYEKTTIRDMLTMRSNIAGFEPWWGKYDDRVRAYYNQSSQKPSGTLFYYDSMGSCLLGGIVEKLTGKTFLQYLKDKVLSKMGFSEESRVMYAPGKYTFGDSGVLCTAYDLLLFARFVMDKGVYDGVRYIDEEFMRSAVSPQSFCNMNDDISLYKSCGYGYLIWMMPRGGFAFIGMGNQLAVCDVENDLVFVFTSNDGGCEEVAREIVLSRLYEDLMPAFSNDSHENGEGQEALCEYISSASLLCLNGNEKSPVSDKIDGKKYLLCENHLGIKWFSLTFDTESSYLEFEKENKTYRLYFGINKNVAGNFPTEKRNSDRAGELSFGSYSCLSSGCWETNEIFHIRAMITDTYLGRVNVYFHFLKDNVCIDVKKRGQYLLDGIEGYFIGKTEGTEK